jgi:GTPase
MVSHCGYIAIVGRSNVGKSTLLNSIVKRKHSITAQKTQTTRHRILAIKTEGEYQAIYVDTPGLHTKEVNQLNKAMNHTASEVMTDVDVIVFVIDRTRWSDDDEFVLSKLPTRKIPIILVINKVDRMQDKAALLPWLETLSQKYYFNAIIPLSAKTGKNLLDLEKEIQQYLPESVHFFPDDCTSDRPPEFFAAEFIREKLTRLLGDELPYALAVGIDKYEDTGKQININAVIYVERRAQKPIVIGKGGEKLKEVGTQARIDLEKFFNKKVFLRIWVKIKAGWSDDTQQLQQFGYRE